MVVLQLTQLLTATMANSSLFGCYNKRKLKTNMSEPYDSN